MKTILKAAAAVALLPVVCVLKLADIYDRTASRFSRARTAAKRRKRRRKNLNV